MASRSSENYDYLRVRISGELRTESFMHCGDGSDLPAKDWVSEKRKGEKGRIDTVFKGLSPNNGEGTPKTPYIPAATLRGSLLSRSSDPDVLFGHTEGDKGRMGKLRVYDAYLTSGKRAQGDLYWNESSQTTLRDGVSIDPITNTAKEHHLFVHEVVTADSVFVFELEADRITEVELTTLLGLLQGWDGSMEAAIGKGRSRGWGRIRWSGTPTVEVLTDEAVRRWMDKGADPFPPLTPIEASGGSIEYETRAGQIVFSISPASPILVNDPGRVGEKDPNDDDDHAPDLEFTRTADGQAMLPGSGLRGVLRAHAGRILATIAHQQYDAAPADAGKFVQPLLQRLFGTEGRRSLIWVGDAIAEETRLHRQTFNAVDRFTGGVAKTALYSAAAADCKSLRGTCAIDLHPCWVEENGDWWKGLLLLAIRDFMEGDLMLGWGKARGFGKASLAIDAIDGTRMERFEDLLAVLETRFGASEPLAWLEDLHNRVAEYAHAAGEEK